MKHTLIRSLIASACVALALTVGAVSPAPAEDHVIRQSPEKYENIFLGEIETTNYAEFRSEPGVVGEVELVRERYPDGKVRVERQVTLDGEGNYVNHGAWKQYSTKGDVVAEGQYSFGQRVGMWTHWIGRNDSKLLSQYPYKQFKAPFMSQVNFTDGKMEGDWIVTDANEQKVLAISLKAGERNGTATTWLPNGKVFWQMTYDQSVPVGDMLEINPKTGELIVAATIDRGRKIVTKTDYYPRNKQMKSQINYLAAKSIEQSQDDFWSMKLAQYGTEGDDVRHGAAKTWFANGQLEQEGFYTNDKKTGTFTYWHKNGQMATTGEYRDDQADGTWVWWHENGQKSAVGKYEQGKLVGDWRWWDDQGKLTKQQTYTGTESVSTENEEHVDVSHRAARGSRR